MILDAVAYAVNVENQGSNLDGDHASGVAELVLLSVYNFPETGSLDIAGDVYEYTAVDEQTNTVTLSGVTTADYDDGERVELSPAAPVWYATVVVGSDQAGFNAMVPVQLVALLSDGFWPAGIPVILESISAGEYQWQVVAAPGLVPTHNATEVPIVVSNADGESAMVDADGFSTSTNDPIPVRTIPTTAFGVASDGTSLFVLDWRSDIESIRKFDPTTGIENTSGFPIAGIFKKYTIATDGTSVFAISNSNDDIRKFNASTGVETLVGWPIVGTYIDALASNGTHLFAIDSAGDIRKFNASTGAAVGGGFPIVGTYKFGLATDGTAIYAIDSAGDIRKFDAATAVEDTSGDFPIAGNFYYIDAHDGVLYANEAGAQIRKFDAATGEEILTSGFPIEGAFPHGVAADGTFIYGVDNRLDSRLFNNAENYGSTRTDSSDGTFTGHAARVSDLDASGNVDVKGTLDAGGLASLPLLGNSAQKALTLNAVPTSTTNVTMPSLDMTFSVNGPEDVVWVDCHAAVTIGVANTANIIELLIDGVAQAAQLWTRANAVNNIITGAQKWRLTGLAAGSHTATFRTRNTAAATSATVNVGPTVASYWTNT